MATAEVRSAAGDDALDNVCLGRAGRRDGGTDERQSQLRRTGEDCDGVSGGCVRTRPLRSLAC